MRSPGRICGRMTILEHVWDYDFDPGTNLVEAVKGYMGFEQSVLTRVTEARANAVAAGAQGPAQQASAEGVLTGALRSLFAVVENYPELKANENVMQLQEQLTTTENQISFSRQHYNASVLDYPIGTHPLFNWLFYGYGLPLLAFAADIPPDGGHGGRRAGRPDRRRAGAGDELCGLPGAWRSGTGFLGHDHARVSRGTHGLRQPRQRIPPRGGQVGMERDKMP